jgi:hypothetical protein
MALPLIAELARRRVFRAVIVYAALAFAVLQIIEPIMHGLHWPEVVLSYVVVALALGFPVVVGLAWVFDVRATGVERTPSSRAITLRGGWLAAVLKGERILRGRSPWRDHQPAGKDWNAEGHWT